MATLTPTEVVKAWLRAFNRADAEAMVGFYAPAASLHLVPEQPLQGLEAIHREFLALFTGPEQIWMVENLFENGEWAILEWRDPQGLRGCGFFQVLDGQIAVQRCYMDRLSFLRQHGLPVPRELA